MSKETITSRVDKEWEKIARDIMSDRYGKGLAKGKPKEIGLPEFTRLQLKCPSWRLVENELRNLPKKRNEK